MFELDDIDRQLLFEMSLDGRIGLTELAQKVDMSKQSVAYRLNRLRKSDIIKRVYAITNVYRLGKTHFRVFLKLQNINKETEKALRAFLLEHPQIAWVVYLDGDFDILFVVWADNIIAFEKVYDEVVSRFGLFIQEKHFSVATRIEYLPYYYLRPPSPVKADSWIFGACFESSELDDLDRLLLTHLNRTGRSGISELSRDLKVSPQKIRTRMKRLEELKVVLGYTVKLDHQQLGYVYRKVLLRLNDTSAAYLETLSQHLKEQPSVIFLLKTLGTYDFEFELMSRSSDEFYNLLKNLRLFLGAQLRDLNTVIMSDEPRYEDLSL
jgi:DNA-binding Lrp family transcriptional regulator